MPQLKLSVRHILVLILVGLIPFHAFLITWLRDVWPAGGFLAAWKEGLMVLLLLIGGGELILKRHSIKLDRLDLALSIYIGVALIWGIVQKETVTQWLFGMRIDVLPFIVFGVLRHVTWSEQQKEQLYKVIYISSVIILSFGILQALVLPRDFLVNFGYGTAQDMLTAGEAITGCQYLEHTAKVCRAIATFGGPTRYGVYLLVIAGVVLPFLRTKKRHLTIVGGLIALNIFLTYSRSVWVAAAVMVIIGSFFFASKKMRRVLAGLIIIGVVAVGVTGILVKDLDQHQSLLRSIIVRASSSGEHMTYLKKGLDVLVAHPMGIGLGTVGPASLRFTPFLTENWFLQIAIEMGMVGIAAFMWMLIEMGMRLYKTMTVENRGLLLALIGICVTGLFTHSFEESAATVTLLTVGSALLRGD